MRKLFGLFIFFIVVNTLDANDDFQISTLNFTQSSSGSITVSNILAYDSYETNPQDVINNGKYLFTFYLTTGEIRTFFHDVNGAGGNSLTFNPSSGGNKGILEAVALYDDTNDDPKRIGFDFNTTPLPGDYIDGGNNVDSALVSGDPNLEFYFVPNKFLNTTPIKPRVGDKVLYRLKYSNSCDPNTYAGKVNLTVSEGTISQIYNPYGNSSINVISSTAIEISYSNLNFNQFRDCYVLLDLDGNITANEILFTVENSFKGATCDSVGITHPLAQKGDPHDPNLISSSVKTICPDNPPKELEYFIVFENIGTGPADSVMIWMDIPQYFKTNPIKLTNRRHLSGLNQVLNQRRIKWKIQSSDLSLKRNETSYKLLGGNQQGITNFNHTRDTVPFKLYFNRDVVLPPCGQIPIQATIVFNEEKPFKTNLFTIDIECSNCDSCQTKESQVFNPSSNKKSKYIFNQNIVSGDHYSWYPSHGLDNPNSANPTFYGKLDQLYHLTVSKNCERVTYFVPIELLDDYKEPWFKKYWWIIILAIPLVFLLFKFSKK